LTNFLRRTWLFIRLSRPIFLIGGGLLYALGASIAHYLGHPLDPSRYVLGQGLVLCVQLIAQYLNEYFDAPGDRQNPNRTALSGGSGVLGPDGLAPQVALFAAFSAFALVASLATTLLVRGGSSPVTWLILCLGLLVSIVYSAPPVRLVSSGFGELAVSILVAGLVPSFGYSLQAGGLHILLAQATFPLIAIHMAMLIALQLPDFPADQQSGKKTLSVRLGWRVAMRIHDASLLVASASLVAAALLGFPMRILYSIAIALPLAAAQIWQLWRIRRGFAPLWRSLTLGAVALFTLVVYFELIGFTFG
jgi:1,4-dihydroxy-2-naphthoate octaprenyltransferase